MTRPGSEKLQVLYEQWLECEGHWTESVLVKELRVSARHRRRGARKWLTLSELTQKYGSARVAIKIKEAKEADPEMSKHQVRFHPDCPGEEEPSHWFRCPGCANLYIMYLARPIILTRVYLYFACAGTDDHESFSCCFQIYEFVRTYSLMGSPPLNPEYASPGTQTVPRMGCRCWRRCQWHDHLHPFQCHR